MHGLGKPAQCPAALLERPETSHRNGRKGRHVIVDRPSSSHVGRRWRCRRFRRQSGRPECIAKPNWSGPIYAEKEKNGKCERKNSLFFDFQKFYWRPSILTDGI